VSSPDGAFDAGGVDVDLRSVAAAGIVLVREPSGETSCEIGRAHESGAAPLAPAPEMGAKLAFAVTVAKDGAPKLTHLELAIPGRAMLVVPPLHWDGSVAVAGEKRRGEPLTIRAHGNVGASPRSYDVEIEVETFIVDVIDRNSSAIDRDP
jgi:hypothetical protein